MITVTEMQDQMRQQAIVAEKRRKQREQEDQSARAEREREQPLTPAHIAARAELDAAATERAQALGKGIAGLEAEPGPGTFAEPGRIEPQDLQRGYLRDGHAARAPQSGPPNQTPMPDVPRGVPVSLGELAAPRVSGAPGPAMRGLAQHQAARYVMTSPSLRGGQ